MQLFAGICSCGSALMAVKDCIVAQQWPRPLKQVRYADRSVFHLWQFALLLKTSHYISLLALLTDMNSLM